jgi:hypothetical protein
MAPGLPDITTPATLAALATQEQPDVDGIRYDIATARAHRTLRAPGVGQTAWPSPHMLDIISPSLSQESQKKNLNLPLVLSPACVPG